METVVCPLCGDDRWTDVHQCADRLRPDSTDRYSIVRCNSCSLVYLNPRPTTGEISSYYESGDYDPHGRTGRFYNRLYSGVQYVANHWKSAQLERSIQKGSLLDIGGGVGDFVRFMQDRGWTAALQETDLTARRTASDRGVDAVARIDELPDTSRFDAVTLWHVLEHLHHPLETLKWIREHLTRAGFLALAVPNYNAVDRQWYGTDWAPLEAPRHLLHFTPKTLVNLLKKAKFQPIRVFSFPQDTLYNIFLSTKTRIVRKRGLWQEILTAVGAAATAFMKGSVFGLEVRSTVVMICKKT